MGFPTKRTTKRREKNEGLLSALAGAVERLVEGRDEPAEPPKAPPRGAATTRRKKGPTLSAPKTLPAGLKFTFIDDDAEYLELLKRMLASYDVDVETTDVPERAVEHARARKPDLILLDYQMPGLNGFELVETLRRDEELSGVPRILITGTPRLSALRDVARWDVHDVLCKPVSKQSLVDAIQQALGGWLPARAARPPESESKPAGSPTGATTVAQAAPVAVKNSLADADRAIKAVNSILRQAVSRGASDIHIEPQDKALNVRLRVDGEMTQALELPADLAPAVAARVKVMAELDIAERRLPQDGRFRCDLEPGKMIEVRVSTLPCKWGEKIVLRVLGAQQIDGSLDSLAMSERDREAIAWALDSPNGIVLLTGPTGSGKTTTLYRMLCLLNNGRRNIVTVEDPIELEIPGTTQVSVNPEIGLTFAKALRAFLRQDPDVMLVGEIRDTETAETAARAALTGRLILSTVHTNDAVSTVMRLVDMHVPRYMLAAALRLIVAQRLVRQLCGACRRPEKPTAEETALLASAAVPLDTVWRPGSCADCAGTGYTGRVAVLEVMPIRTASMREQIVNLGPLDPLREAALGEGMRPLARAAYDLVACGRTTVAEAVRAASFD